MPRRTRDPFSSSLGASEIQGTRYEEVGEGGGGGGYFAIDAAQLHMGLTSVLTTLSGTTE